MKILEAAEQMSLFDQDSWCGKTSREHFRAGTQRAKTSGSYSKRSSELVSIPFLSLDLTPGAGNLLGESYWELLSPWRGESLILNTGPAPRSAEDVYSLSQILQDEVPLKYYLSQKACLGILRRAKERGKELPDQLKYALMIQAGIMQPIPSLSKELKAYHINQRDEGIDLHGVSGALMATNNLQMQTFVTGEAVAFTAGFSAGASPTAGSIGWQEECSPTLKAGESGTNMVPSILCLNDQGGQVMDCTLDVAGTIRAQEHGHQPLVMATQQGGAEIGIGICPTITAAAGLSGNNQPVLFENHGIDSRYTGPHKVAPTMSARYGTGGNNVPLISQNNSAICIAGNIIDRQPENGGNGLGCQLDLAYTLTATDKHAVMFSRQRVDVFKDDTVASTQSARQHKDATDLVWQHAVFGQSQFGNYSEGCATLRAQGGDNGGGSENLVTGGSLSSTMLIRRLTPLECERLQGFPDGWTDIPNASDSARYKALGNSVAIPCVEYIMFGIALVLSA